MLGERHEHLSPLSVSPSLRTGGVPCVRGPLRLDAKVILFGFDTVIAGAGRRYGVEGDDSRLGDFASSPQKPERFLYNSHVSMIPRDYPLIIFHSTCAPIFIHVFII